MNQPPFPVYETFHKGELPLSASYGRVAGEGVLLSVIKEAEESEGLSLYELSSLLHEMGCVQAYNLDGGGSSTMVFRGMLVNRPTTNGKRITERSVSDIVYIG